MVPIVLFHNYFSLNGEQPEQHTCTVYVIYQLISPNNQLPVVSKYSNISQILLLYKTWGYCNKLQQQKKPIHISTNTPLTLHRWCNDIPAGGPFTTGNAFWAQNLNQMNLHIQLPCPCTGIYSYMYRTLLSHYFICHESSAVMVCAKLGPRHLIIFQVPEKWNSKEFGLWAH